METVVINPSLVIGPGDRNHVSNLIIWHMLRGRVPPVVAGGLNVVDVADVAQGAAAALLRGRSGRRYLLCGENRTLPDMLLTTARVLGCRPPRLRLPLKAVRALGRGGAVLSRWLGRPLGLELLRAAGLYFYYDGTQSRRALGLGPARPYEPAAAEAAAWYREVEGV
jgi:dihydroflavonol-4-reductase